MLNPNIFTKRSHIIITIILCVIIAYCTEYIFGGGIFTHHLPISLGYGLSFHLMNASISGVYPQWSDHNKLIFSMTAGLLFGITNMMIWLYIRHGIWKVDLLFPSLLATSAIAFFMTYFFINRERAAQAESELKDIQLRQAEQDKALINSQLRNLQGQMEPHFLFNTLANIQVLIDADASKAKKLLEKITDLLRASLKQQRKDSIPIGDEIKLLDSYLAIQQIRLSERMSYKFTLDEKISMHTQIPPFLIQPAVENAVVHGIEPSVKGGYIHVSITQKDKRIIVEVTDNGIGFNDASKGHGLSMNNVRERLSVLYGDKGELQLIPHADGGFTTRITMPCVH